MKKLLVLLTLMVTVFGFTAGAFAAFGDPICVGCKGALRNIPIYTAAAQATNACYGFDYDLNTALDGYCTYSALNNYRAIFQVCNCDPVQAAKLVPGFRVAVKMTILVNSKTGENGAYWSGTGVPATINFNTYLTPALACAAPLIGSQTKTFGAPSFFLSDGVKGAGLTTDVTCTVPAANRATILSTPFGVAPTGYTITLADVNLSSWWIDIPPIRIDPAVAKEGDIISVRVELFDASQTPVCPTCVVPLCGCDIPVAQVGCSVTLTSTLRFPYFTSLTAGNWWNGIAISNPTAAAGTCTLTAYEADGSVGTAKVSVPAKGMFVDTLEHMMATNVWSGSGLGGVQLYIDASCTYGSAFGFAMMGENTAPYSSMGYKVP